MNPPLSPTARRWMLALSFTGATLLAVFLWFAFRVPPSATPSSEPVRAQPEPTLAHAEGAVPKLHRPDVAPAQVRPPALAGPTTIGVRSTETEREQQQPGKPLEERLRLTRSLRPLVGWAKPSLDAGSGATAPGAAR
jgi:hypothetical protein